MTPIRTLDTIVETRLLAGVFATESIKQRSYTSPERWRLARTGTIGEPAAVSTGLPAVADQRPPPTLLTRSGPPIRSVEAHSRLRHKCLPYSLHALTVRWI